MNDRQRVQDAASHHSAGINALLRSVELPAVTAEDAPVQMLVAHHSGSLVGCIGWERHGEVALIRSLAVAPQARSEGLGRRLLQCALQRLAELPAVYLLTDGAAAFFVRFGFEAIERSSLPAALAGSRQLTLDRCSQATAMRRLPA